MRIFKKTYWVLAFLAIPLWLGACGDSTPVAVNPVTTVAPTSALTTASATTPAATTALATTPAVATIAATTAPVVQPTISVATSSTAAANPLKLVGAEAVTVDKAFLDSFVANFAKGSGVGPLANGWSYAFYTSEVEPVKLLEDNVSAITAAGWQVNLSSLTLFDGSGLTLSVYGKGDQNLLVGAQPMLKDLAGVEPFKGKKNLVYTIQGKGVLSALMGGGNPTPK